MLKINGKEVIYSKSFVMAKGDDVVLTPPGVIGRSIKIVAVGMASMMGSGTHGFRADESDVRLTVLTVPFADTGAFVADFERGQLSSEKGPLSCRVAGQTLGANAMLVHFDIHEGRYDNHVDPEQKA